MTRAAMYVLSISLISLRASPCAYENGIMTEKLLLVSKSCWRIQSSSGHYKRVASGHGCYIFRQVVHLFVSLSFSRVLGCFLFFLFFPTKPCKCCSRMCSLCWLLKQCPGFWRSSIHCGSWCQRWWKRCEASTFSFTVLNVKCPSPNWHIYDKKYLQLCQAEIQLNLLLTSCNYTVDHLGSVTLQHPNILIYITSAIWWLTELSTLTQYSGLYCRA